MMAVYPVQKGSTWRQRVFCNTGIILHVRPSHIDWSCNIFKRDIQPSSVLPSVPSTELATLIYQAKMSVLNRYIACATQSY